MRIAQSASRHARLVTCALLAALSAPAIAQTVQFRPVAPAVLDERFLRVADKIEERERALHSLFEEAGCTGERLTEQAVKKSRTPNLICTLEGTLDSTIVVTAHYDLVPAGHGAVDNWSGASMLPSLYQSLSAPHRRFRFVFIGFASEETGLVGSRAYVKTLDPDEKAKIRAMVNLDCLGLSPTKVWASRSDKDLLSTAIRVAQSTQQELSGMDIDKVGDSDSRPFKDAKIPVIDFHSITAATFPILHSSRDTVKAVHLDEYQKSYKFLATYLAYLDTALEPKPAETK